MTEVEPAKPEEKKYKPLISRRILIASAIVVMVASLFTGHVLATYLIFLSLILLVLTIFLSISMGCGACWASFWLSDQRLNCMERSK